MKIQKLEEVRKNVHQAHLEDLVLLGKDDFNEIHNKIDLFEKTLEGEDVGLNTTVKIDGAPAVVCWHEFPGYPNDSVCLKSFISGPEKAKVISSEEELRTGKYADSPKMLDMLSYCLELAKYIPSGEAWQGDCLFTKNTKEERKINGKNYITFLPNTIIYAFSEDNPGYENIKNADFGIAFHTIYTGTAEDLNQSFRVDASELNLPSNIYVLSPVLHASTNKADYNIDKIRELEKDLKKVEDKLVNNPVYNDLVNNKEFQTFWGTFENKNYADYKLYQINVDTLIDDLKDHLESRAPKMSKIGVTRVSNLIENNKDILVDIVKSLNIASQIKMLLWHGFNNTAEFDYDSFYYNNETGEYIPTTMEGVAMSDADGNIVKIVDRPTFASNNRNQAFAKGFKHENLILGEDMRDKGEIVFAFGRMNPPTKGHEKLVRFMGDISAENKPRLYLSHTQDKKKNPLSYEDKIKFVKKLAEPEVDVIDTDLREILYIVVALQQEGFSKITLVCGEDRRESFYNLLLAYNGKTLKNGSMYNFPEENINVISAGDRDPDSDDPLVRASATNMRKYATNNDFESFKENSPFDEQTSKELFTKVRKGLLLEKLTLTEAEEEDEFDKEGILPVFDMPIQSIGNKSIRTAYNSLLKKVDSTVDKNTEKLLQDTVDDIEHLTNSLKVDLINKLSKKLEEHSTGFSVSEFVSKFKPTQDDLDKLLNNDGYGFVEEININKLNFSEYFINNLISCDEVNSKGSTTNTGPFELAIALLFKNGAMSDDKGDVKIGNYKVEVKSVKKPDGDSTPAVIGLSAATNSILRAFDGFISEVLGRDNSVNKNSFGNMEIDKELLPSVIKSIVGSSGKILFEELFNKVFEKVITLYANDFNYLAVCRNYTVTMIEKSNLIDELVKSGKYSIVFKDNRANGRRFKINKLVRFKN